MRDIYENFDIIPPNKRIAIWGINQRSSEIFCETLNRRIPVAFFVDVAGEFHRFNRIEKKKLFGKPFVTTEEFLDRISTEQDIFILADKERTTVEELQWMEENFQGAYYVCSTSELDPAIRNSSSIYIYGAGDSGRRTYKLLRENGITISAFIDSDSSKWGGHIEDAVIDAGIYGPEILDEDDIVVISTRYYSSIKEKLLKIGIHEEKIYVDIRNSAEFAEEPLQYKDRIKLWFEYTRCAVIRAIDWKCFFLMMMADYCDKKNVILYGMNEFTPQFVSLFALIGVKVLYCAECDGNFKRNAVFVTGMECRNVYDLTDEDMSDKIVYVVKVGETDSGITDADYTILEKAGLIFFKEIRLFEEWACGVDRNMRVERNLGTKGDDLLFYSCTYKMTSAKYPGYVVLGNESTASKRIMILGGSTSDIGFYERFIKSWPEFLADKLKDTVIFCGAIRGYNSKQELLKLIRDGRQLHADLVISYSGVNDMLQNHTEGYPYARRRLFSEREWGLKTDTSLSEEWIESENMMKIIAAAYGADFIGVFQPILSNKNEHHMVFSEKIVYKCLEEWCCLTLDEYEEYQKDVRKKIRNIPFIYDMTELFQNEREEVYRDICHLTEKGNRILADEVCKIISKREGYSEQIILAGGKICQTVMP